MRRTSSPATPSLFAFLALALLVPALGGCDKKQPDPPAPPPTPTPQAGGPDAQPAAHVQGGREVTQNPAVLLDTAVPVADITLHGVKLGDPKSNLAPADLGGEPDLSGWVGFKGRENVFRLDQDKVAVMTVSDPAVLSQLGVAGEQDLVAKLGKPDETIEAAPGASETSFRFNDRKLTVWWNRGASKVTMVTIGE